MMKNQGGDLFIVDNSNQEWKVRDYLEQWADLSVSFDIATGFFEIGALLALDGQWQKLEKLRILMGDEVSRRTRQALLDGVKSAGTILDASIEREKDHNDFLTGVPAIVDALESGRSNAASIPKKNSTPRPISPMRSTRSSVRRPWSAPAISPIPA